MEYVRYEYIKLILETHQQGYKTVLETIQQIWQIFPICKTVSNILGCAVHFRFEAKLSEIEAKFFSVTSEKKGWFRIVSLESETAENGPKMNQNLTKLNQK